MYIYIYIYIYVYIIYIYIYIYVYIYIYIHTHIFFRVRSQGGMFTEFTRKQIDKLKGINTSWTKICSVITMIVSIWIPTLQKFGKTCFQTRSWLGIARVLKKRETNDVQGRFCKYLAQCRCILLCWCSFVPMLKFVPSRQSIMVAMVAATMIAKLVEISNHPFESKKQQRGWLPANLIGNALIKGVAANVVTLQQRLNDRSAPNGCRSLFCYPRREGRMFNISKPTIPPDGNGDINRGREQQICDVQMLILRD